MRLGNSAAARGKCATMPRAIENLSLRKISLKTRATGAQVVAQSMRSRNDERLKLAAMRPLPGAAGDYFSAAYSL